jgi:threonine dehydrogenase-like Zn-dependent dehydrogenase
MYAWKRSFLPVMNENVCGPPSEPARSCTRLSLSTAAMNRKQLSVAIIGAGVGGLCLAQGLKASGVVTDVFERDASLCASAAKSDAAHRFATVPR